MTSSNGNPDLSYLNGADARVELLAECDRDLRSAVWVVRDATSVDAIEVLGMTAAVVDDPALARDVDGRDVVLVDAPRLPDDVHPNRVLRVRLVQPWRSVAEMLNFDPIDVRGWDDVHKDIACSTLLAQAQGGLWESPTSGLSCGSEDAAQSVASQPAPAAGGIRLMGWREVMDLPAPRWLIRGWLQEKTVVVLAGAPGSCKTLHVLDWALRAAHGMDWRGCKIRPHSSLILAGEGWAGLSMRFRAWAKHHAPAATSPNYVEIGSTVPLIAEPAGQQQVEDAILACRAKYGHVPEAVWIDTLSCALGGAEENASEVLAPVFAFASRLREKYGIMVGVLHHITKLKPGEKLTLTSVRGSGAITGNSDIVHGMVNTAAGSSLVALKMKDAEKLSPVKARLHVVPLGTDEDGAPCSSVVMVEDDGVNVAAEAYVHDHAVLGSLEKWAMAGSPVRTISQVAKDIDLPQGTTRDAILRLVKAKKLTQVGGGKGRGSTGRYRLTDPREVSAGDDVTDDSEST